MSNNRAITARRIAELVGGTIEGDPEVSVHWIAPVDTAGEGELTFAADEKYAARLADSKASVALVGDKPENAPMTLVRVEDVNAAVASLLSELAPQESVPSAGIHPSAVVAEDAAVDPSAAVGAQVVIGAGSTVGAGSVLQPGVVLGASVTVGDGCVLHENVVVKDRCRLGSRVVVGPGSVIGFSGFGYFTDPSGVHHLVPHAGDVVIEDDVEIGACCCVDRAKFGSTRIGAGTKIDNLVQVAHNVQVGEGCLLVGQCGIAGSAVLGNHVVLGGHAGVRDNISLGDGVQCSAFAAVAGNIPDGAKVAGLPARPAREAMRIAQSTEKLPELLKRMKKLEAKVNKLASPDDA